MQSVSEEARDLISKIFVDKSQRLTAEGILNHPWFSGFNLKCDFEIKDSKSIKRYLNSTKFLRFFYSKLSEYMTNNESDLTFHLIDRDGDGCLSKNELVTGISKFIQSEELKTEILEILNVGLDDDEKLSYSRI